MQTIIEELLDYKYTVFSIHQLIRVVDQHVSSKKWLPQIEIIEEMDSEDENYEYKYTTINGKEHGMFEEWIRGFKVVECHYVHGKLHGLFQNTSETCQYIDGEKNGIYEKYWNHMWSIYDEPKKKHTKGTYLKGKLHGQSETWYRSGQLHKRNRWNYGKKHGLVERWYENGNPMKVYTCDNGVLHGLYKTWYRSGKKWNVCKYVNGQIHGVYKEYDENGKLIKMHKYNHGIRIN